MRDLLLEQQFARGDLALRRVGLVVATHEFELAAAQHAAFRVDFIDRDRQAARDRFAGFCRLTRQGRDETDLDDVRRRERTGDGKADGHCCQA